MEAVVLGSALGLLSNRLVRMAVIAVACGALGFHQAWVWRGQQKDAQHAAATEALNGRLDLARAQARRTAQLLIAQAEAYQLELQEIENAARSEPGADRTALPRNSVRRVFSVGDPD